MPFLYILLIIVLFSTLPLVFLITKKASEGGALRRAVVKAGGTFIPTHRFWYLGSQEKAKCDFHVVYGKRIISVKVISLVAKRTFINFVNKTTYEIKVLGKSESFEDAEKRKFSVKKKKPYDFGFKRPENYGKLPQARVILLNHPLPAKVTKTVGAERITLSRGADTGEGELYKTNEFIKLFK